MDVKAVFGGVVSTLGVVTGATSFDEKLRILDCKTTYLRAKIDDFTAENEQRGNKRMRYDDDLWLAQGLVLLDGAEELLRQVRDGRPPKRRQAREGRGFSFSVCAKVHKFINQLAEHEMKADVLSRTDAVGQPRRGDHIPVKQLIGKGALNALEHLSILVGNSEVGNIAICGRDGIGKTILMKHLYNRVLKWVGWFDYVLWITCPEQFSVHHLQDAVAAALKCDISNISDLTVRAEALSCGFSNLGISVIFLDALPNADFSLKQVGIPDHSDVNGCKVVLTTRFSSVCETLGCSEVLRLDCLPEEEALELFLHEARLDAGSVSVLENEPNSLAEECHGVPSKIVDVASLMCGIHDICEWRNKLFELRRNGKEKKCITTV